MRAAEWTGFYVGAHVGGAAAVAPVDYSDGTSSDGIGFIGAAGGGFAGYNLRLNPNWVAGIEVDGTWFSLGNSDFDSTHNADINWMASVVGRVGYLFSPSTLFFGKLGWALMGLDIPPTSYLAPGTGSKTLNGIQVGLGVESEFAPRWKVRVEGLYTAALEDYTAHGFGLTFDIRPEIISARVGLAYAFGDGRPSAEAAPPPRRGFSWSGLYVGGQAGAAISDTREDYFQGPITGKSWDGFGARNINAGGFVGVNWQIGAAVVGLEFDALWLGQSNEFEFLDLTWGRIDWMTSLNGRAGFLIDPATLVYGKVGWALIDFASNYPNFPTGPSNSKVLNGLQLGLGIETAITASWTLRVEGDYTKALEGLEFGLPDQGHSFVPELISAEVGLAYRF